MWGIIWSLLIRFWPYVSIGLLSVFLALGANMCDKPETVRVTGGTYVKASDGYEPTIGCATGRQFIGWAHKTKK